jgi:hypothetical protein
MGLKQRSEKFFRGWLPTEPRLQSHSFADPQIKVRQKIQLPKGRILITIGWTALALINLLRGDVMGVLFLWFVTVFGVSLVLDISVLNDKQIKPKRAAALSFAAISLGGAFATVYIFSVSASFFVRALSLGLLMVVHVPLLVAVIAYVWGKKDLSKKLVNWFVLWRN